MKIKNSYTFGLGLFLAPFIAFILIVSLSPGNPSDSEVDKYIKASSEIIIPISKTINLKSTDWTGRFVNGDETSFTNSVRYYLNFRKNRYKEYEVFYSSSFKKYFVIESYNKSMSNLIDQDRKEAQAMVNEQELKNPKYGTLQNPIPILWLTEYEKLSDPINYQKY